MREEEEAEGEEFWVKKKVSESFKVIYALSFWRLLLVWTSFTSAYSYIYYLRDEEIGWIGARLDMAKGKTKTQVKPKKSFYTCKKAELHH